MGKPQYRQQNTEYDIKKDKESCPQSNIYIYIEKFLKHQFMKK